MSENGEATSSPGTLAHALWWARRMGRDVERARIRWLEIERQRKEAENQQDPRGDGDVWAVEQWRHGEWRVSSLHWSRTSATRQLAGCAPARWRVEPWLVHGEASEEASEA
jgi:hypothetical protein